MSYLEHLARLPQHVIRPGLGRMTAACAALGDPQAAYPSLLVAGTNGKGSTCAFLEAALREAGLSVGLYTSPHLVRFEERIRVNGREVEGERLERAFAELARAFPQGLGGEEALTYFEAATVLAFLAFAAANVDVAVLEVGLGGRLDATSVPGSRLAACGITRVSLDHTDYLGSTLAAIAGEKAAIARPGVPLVTAPQAREVLAVIERVAAERGAPLVKADPLHAGRWFGRRWLIDDLTPGLLGEHQRENAAVALAMLEESGLPVTAEQARAGVARARWPGRLEIVAERPRVVLDGAHNEDGALALARAHAVLWPEVRPQVVLGVLSDKDHRAIARALRPLAAYFHTCAPDSPRALPAEELAAALAATGAGAQAHATVADAIAAARAAAGEEGAVLVCGSLYVVGEARRNLAG